MCFGVQPEEPLLLKMESRLSLFTIWRPERSLRLPHRHLISPQNRIGAPYMSRSSRSSVRSLACPVGRFFRPSYCVDMPRQPAAGFSSLPPSFSGVGGGLGSPFTPPLALVSFQTVTSKRTNANVLTIYGQACNKRRIYGAFILSWRITRKHHISFCSVV